MMPSHFHFCCFCSWHLPFAIWLSMVLAGLAVSDFSLSLLQACVSVLLGDQLSPGSIWVWRTVAQSQFWAQTETGRILSQATPWFLCPEGSRQVPQIRSGGLPCAHRCVYTSGRRTLSQRYLGITIYHFNYDIPKSCNLISNL